MRTRLPKGVRKYIRDEKARIRRTVHDAAERERLLKELAARWKGFGRPASDAGAAIPT